MCVLTGFGTPRSANNPLLVIQYIKGVAAVLLLLFSTSCGFGISNGDLRRHRERACEGYEIHLKCPGNDLIHVQRAAYGRQDDMTCVVESHEMRDTHCILPNAKDVVAKRCNGNTSCDLFVGSETFENPCPGTKKYLNVMYECVPFIISCPGKLKYASLTSRTSTALNENAYWMKDPYQVSDRWYYMGYTEGMTRQLYEYENLEDLTGGKRPKTFYHLPYSVEGTGFVVYDRNLFFTPEGTNSILRFDFSTQNIGAKIDLPGAIHGGTSPYSVGLSTDIDLAVDENGLWAIYATEYNDGNIVISRLRHYNLAILKTWTTSYYKLSALNAFIVCGVLYTVDAETLHIDYMFNTSSNSGNKVNIPVPRLSRNASTINYNPKDQILYVWDKKTAINYQLYFDPINLFSTTSHATVPKNVIPTTSVTEATAIAVSRTTINYSGFRKCKGRQNGGLLWPDTNYRAVAQLKCPGSSRGYVHWVCGGNVSRPTWVSPSPDFTQCVSTWIRAIEQELRNGGTSVVQLSQKFTNTLRQKTLNGNSLIGWDIATSVRLLRTFLREAASERRSAAALMGSILKSSSMLLDLSTKKAWNALGVTMQTQLASEMIQIVEDAAFFLACDISTALPRVNKREQSNINPAFEPATRKKLNWSENMVSLGIRVDPLPVKLADSYQNLLWASHGDRLNLQTSSVIETIEGSEVDGKVQGLVNQTMTRRLAFVALFFKNLGDYLNDIELSRSHVHSVNSHILSVSAAIIEMTASDDLNRGGTDKVNVNIHKNQKLSRPVSMTILHDRADWRYHACVFWNKDEGSSLGSWSQEGCKRVAGNASHSTCECDHMTAFAVLSSNTSFNDVDNSNDEPMKTNIKISDISFNRGFPIIRSGLAISVFFLFLVVVTLISLRHLQSELNTIHKNLILCLVSTEIIFSCGFDRTMISDVCGVVAALLHFGLLATFTWAALESYHLLTALGAITESRKRWRWYYCVGYGIPTIVVSVSAAVDHTSYGSIVVCWLQTDGNFIWSFIGPCCFLITACLLLLALTMYRLHIYSNRFPDTRKEKKIRFGAACSCVLMFFLCSQWSCGVLWLSNFYTIVTSILFCIFSCFHGISSFIFYCYLPCEVRNQYTKCLSRFTKNTSKDHHLPRNHLLNSENGRQDNSVAYGGYSYTAGYTTTLLPVSAHRSALIANATDMVDGFGGSMPNMNISALKYAENNDSSSSKGSSCDISEETIPKQYLNSFTRPYPVAGTYPNEYGPPQLRHSKSVSRHYEQPIPPNLRCSTVSSGASGPYNHLHENYPGGSHHHLASSSCQIPAEMCCTCHQYEAIDHSLRKKCHSGYGIQLQLNETGEPKIVHYRSCFDKAHYEPSAPDPENNNRNQNGFYPRFDGVNPPIFQELVTTLPRDSFRNGAGLNNVKVELHHGRQRTNYRTTNSHRTVKGRNGPAKQIIPRIWNKSYGYNQHSVKMGTVGMVIPRNHGKVTRINPDFSSYSAGKVDRNSDPLSTDQGYDTDSHQQGVVLSRSEYNPPSTSQPPRVLRSDNSTCLNHFGSHAGERSSLLDGSKNRNERETQRTRTSASNLSVCSSENGQEVNRILNIPKRQSDSSVQGDGGLCDDDDITPSPRDVTEERERFIVAPPSGFSHTSEEGFECTGRLCKEEPV